MVSILDRDTWLMEKRGVMRWLMVSLLTVLFCTSVKADKITIAADSWCPFNCQPGAELPGFMVEVAKRAFSAKGHEVVYLEVNWSRAIQEARKGNLTAIIGAFKGDAPDFVFPDHELAVLGNTFFVHKENDWTYQGLDSLKRIQLAAINGYDYGDELRGYIQESGSASVTLLGGDQYPLRRGIRMLSLRRVDALVEADPVFWYNANLLGKADQFKVAGRASEPMKSYIAFSPRLPESEDYARILSEGIASMRASGELDEILAKYGLKDWRITKK